MQSGHRVDLSRFNTVGAACRSRCEGWQTPIQTTMLLHRSASLSAQTKPSRRCASVGACAYCLEGSTWMLVSLVTRNESGSSRRARSVASAVEA